jgi:hypothetical protein
MMNCMARSTIDEPGPSMVNLRAGSRMGQRQALLALEWIGP